MKKAIIIGLACLTAGTGLTGCGVSGNNTETTATTSETTTTAGTTETTTITIETTTTTEVPAMTETHKEDDILQSFLQKIYSEADMYADDYPVYIYNRERVLRNTGEDHYNTYNRYMIADLDNDGKDELLLSYIVGYVKDAKKDDNTFDKNVFLREWSTAWHMYEVDENGNVTEKESWAGTPAFDYNNTKITVRDNSTICFESSNKTYGDLQAFGVFDKELWQEINKNQEIARNIPDYANYYQDGDYFVYWNEGTEDSPAYNHDYQIMDYGGLHTGKSADPLTVEEYERQMGLLKKGNIIEKDFNSFTGKQLGLTPGEVETTTSTSETPVQAYEWLLDKYRGIVGSGEGGFDREDTTFQEYGSGFVESLLYHFPVSYSLKDLDGNATPELMVWSGFDLSAAYTVVDNEVKPLAFSGYRNIVKLNDDGIFYDQGSNSAFDGVYEIFKMSGDGGSLAIDNCYDYEYRETTNYNKYEKVNGDFFDYYKDGVIPVSEEEFNSIQNMHQTAEYTGERQKFR